MLTVDEFRSLEQGDIVEMGTPFKGLDGSEPLNWMVTQIAATGREKTFEAWYCEVYVGCWVCREAGGALIWTQGD